MKPVKKAPAWGSPSKPAERASSRRHPAAKPAKEPAPHEGSRLPALKTAPAMQSQVGGHLLGCWSMLQVLLLATAAVPVHLLRGCRRAGCPALLHGCILHCRRRSWARCWPTCRARDRRTCSSRRRGPSLVRAVRAMRATGPAAVSRIVLPLLGPRQCQTPACTCAGSARGAPATPLSRFMSETALQEREKQRLAEAERAHAAAQQAAREAAAQATAPPRRSGPARWFRSCLGLL